MASKKSKKTADSIVVLEKASPAAPAFSPKKETPKKRSAKPKKEPLPAKLPIDNTSMGRTEEKMVNKLFRKFLPHEVSDILTDLSLRVQALENVVKELKTCLTSISNTPK